MSEQEQRQEKVVEEEKAEAKAEKKERRKGKKQRKPKRSSKRWQMYDEKGKRVGKFCPRCGPGIFLARHKDRFYCGRCHYTEFLAPAGKPEEHKNPGQEVSTKKK